MDKYKYSPGDHKITATLGSPGHCLLLPFVEMAVFTNDFPLVEVREGLPEGKGLFSKIDIPHYTFLCNYGGNYCQSRKGSIIWMGAGIFVIYMSSVISRMAKTPPTSLITALRWYPWVSLLTTQDCIQMHSPRYSFGLIVNRR